MIFDPISLWPAVFGIGGMLVGGFITYHLVQKELVKLLLLQSNHLRNAWNVLIMRNVTMQMKTNRNGDSGLVASGVNSKQNPSYNHTLFSF